MYYKELQDGVLWIQIGRYLFFFLLYERIEEQLKV